MRGQCQREWMLMQEDASGNLVITYAEMVENNDGDFCLGELHTFCAENRQSSANSGMDPTPDEAVLAWTLWMRSQGDEVVELPRTARTKAWGYGWTFSITPKGTDSLVYVVNVGECGYRATEMIGAGAERRPRLAMCAALYHTVRLQHAFHSHEMATGEIQSLCVY
jgi:hypothetical protein